MAYAEVLAELNRKNEYIALLKTNNTKLREENNELAANLKFMHEWVQGKIEHAYQTKWSKTFQQWIETNKRKVAEVIITLIHQVGRPVTYDEIEEAYELKHGKVARDTVKRVARALSQKDDEKSPFLRVKYKEKIALTPRIWEVD